MTQAEDLAIQEVLPEERSSRLALDAATLLCREAWDYRLLPEQALDFIFSARPDKRLLIASNEADLVVAAGTMRDLSGNRTIITEIATAADHRRRGVGRRMVEALEHHAREAGRGTMALYPLAAHGFFMELGYRREPDDNPGSGLFIKLCS